MSTDMPQTIEEIAQDVVRNLEPAERAAIKAVPSKDEMLCFHHGAGTGIRNKYKLWEPDHPLTRRAHADDVSMEVLYLVWELCQ